jgi:hypothetical protein
VVEIEQNPHVLATKSSLTNHHKLARNGGPVISATREAETRRIMAQGQPGKKVRPYPTNGHGDICQLVPATQGVGLGGLQSKASLGKSARSS